MNPHVSGSQATVAVTACQPACERCVPPADRPLTCHGPAKNPADHGFCKRLLGHTTSAARTGTTTDTNRWLLWVRYLLSVQMGDAYAADWHESL